MKTARRLLLMAIALMAPAARSATLTYTSTYRYLECGTWTIDSTDPFGNPDMGLAGLDTIASQRTVPGARSIAVSSRVAGQTERAAAFLTIIFNLDEPAEWNLTGSFELLGSDGFACVSFQDLAHRDTTIVNEIIHAPPVVFETRTLRFGGLLEPGSYLLEAMIYGGGDSQFTRGGIDAVLTIPEPEAPLLFMTALLCRTRRRSVIH